jgi:hypothetical protein
MALLAELSDTQTELFGNRSLDGVNGDPVCMDVGKKLYHCRISHHSNRNLRHR